jgi:hypothetical protein
MTNSSSIYIFNVNEGKYIDELCKDDDECSVEQIKQKTKLDLEAMSTRLFELVSNGYLDFNHTTHLYKKTESYITWRESKEHAKTWSLEQLNRFKGLLNDTIRQLKDNERINPHYEYKRYRAPNINIVINTMDSIPELRKHTLSDGKIIFFKCSMIIQNSLNSYVLYEMKENDVVDPALWVDKIRKVGLICSIQSAIYYMRKHRFLKELQIEDKKCVFVRVYIHEHVPEFIPMNHAPFITPEGNPMYYTDHLVYHNEAYSFYMSQQNAYQHYENQNDPILDEVQPSRKSSFSAVISSSPLISQTSSGRNSLIENQKNSLFTEQSQKPIVVENNLKTHLKSLKIAFSSLNTYVSEMIILTDKLKQ